MNANFVDKKQRAEFLQFDGSQVKVKRASNEEEEEEQTLVAEAVADGVAAFKIRFQSDPNSCIGRGGPQVIVPYSPIYQINQNNFGESFRPSCQRLHKVPCGSGAAIVFESNVDDDDTLTLHYESPNPSFTAVGCLRVMPGGVDYYQNDEPSSLTGVSRAGALFWVDRMYEFYEEADHDHHTCPSESGTVISRAYGPECTWDGEFL